VDLSSAIASALSGPRSAQAPLSIVPSSVGNAGTASPVARNPAVATTGSFGPMVATAGLERQLALFMQNQLRSETSDGSYADQVASVLNQLQNVFGMPGSKGSLDGVLNGFVAALQSLATGPNKPSAQKAALTAAQTLAKQLNSTTTGIQTLRNDVERDIGKSAGEANEAMAEIADLNTRLQGLGSSGSQSATLQDQRDNAINTLARYVDVRVVTDGANGVSVFTGSGVQLVGADSASAFAYTSPGTLDAMSHYDADAAKNGVGRLNIDVSGGASVDVVANRAIASGRIAADLKLRDQTLVQAQTQIDQLAASMASALSNKISAANMVAGQPSAFSVPTAGLLAGNTINLTYIDAGNFQRQIAIINVTDPDAPPLHTPGSHPGQIGVNFSAGMASAVAELNSALGHMHLRFGAAGSDLIVTDDGTRQATVKAASATTTVQTLASGNAELPMFTDGNAFYTGAVTGAGTQAIGLAGRIAVNPALTADPDKFSTYSALPTVAGNSTRPDFLLGRLTATKFSFSPATGLGSVLQPFQGTVTGYLQQVASQQGNASRLATQLQQGQSIVVSTLRQKLGSATPANMDGEMSNLIRVQDTYAANAQIMSVVQSAMQSLTQALPQAA
jgi:flagellar hook-associated protein 1